jgi:hypothetical protein
MIRKFGEDTVEKRSAVVRGGGYTRRVRFAIQLEKGELAQVLFFVDEKALIVRLLVLCRRQIVALSSSSALVYAWLQ